MQICKIDELGRIIKPRGDHTSEKRTWAGIYIMAFGANSFFSQVRFKELIVQVNLPCKKSCNSPQNMIWCL